MRTALLTRVAARAIAILSVAVLSAAAAPARAADAAPEVVGGTWLTIGSVDRRGRVPFNPDALLRRYTLARGAAPPVAGAVVSGSKDEAATWTSVTAAEDGAVEGKITLAYRSYDSDRDRVVLASLWRGAVLVVNGTPYAGDIYGGGMGPVPVALREGANDIYVRGVRGAFRLTFSEPPSSLVLTGKDTTAPDFRPGHGLQGDEAAVVVANCTNDWMTVVATGSGGVGDFDEVRTRTLLGLAPLSVLKVPVPLRRAADAPDPRDSVNVSVRVWATSGSSARPVVAQGALTIRVAGVTTPFVRTFRSAIDDSVQEYAVRAPADGKARQLVLSLHGAGVACRGQAGAYSPRPGVVVVAATNRRPFGFDWQDWGRQDAYEVLERALAWSGADRSRVCLTGHSMGGHGTWHLAANDPDGFAAIAPSAGWSQFDNYGGGRPEQARREPWRGADAASDTMSLIDNLAQIPTYVLHGAQDDNVPLAEAQRMLKALRAAGAAPQSHFQEGAGHWWDGNVAEGTDCVDWPPIFDLFAASSIPEAPLRIDWTTVDPAVDADHHWVHVEQPLAYGRSVHVEGAWDPGDGSVTLRTTNARLIRIDSPGGDAGLQSVVLDGERLTPDGAARGTWFVREDGRWAVCDGPRGGEKTPAVSGPFKRAFGNRFVLIVGTSGSDEESRELLDRARYDSQVWRYRGNGLAEIVTDTDFAFAPAEHFADRNVIVYGNADSNAAWDLVFAEDCPIRARRGALTAGRQTWERGDLAAVFVQRRRGEPRALAAAFADTGPAGTRLHAALLTFVSGVGYPDYTVFAPSVCENGDGGVLATGWFNHRWRLGRDGRN